MYHTTYFIYKTFIFRWQRKLSIRFMPPEGKSAQREHAHDSFWPARFFTSHIYLPKPSFESSTKIMSLKLMPQIRNYRTVSFQLQLKIISLTSLLRRGQWPFSCLPHVKTGQCCLCRATERKLNYLQPTKENKKKETEEKRGKKGAKEIKCYI